MVQELAGVLSAPLSEDDGAVAGAHLGEALDVAVALGGQDHADDAYEISNEC